MNILITGASGFIASALIQSITDNDKYKNDNIILLTSKEIPNYKCILHKNYTFTKDDFINNGIKIIDVVLHLGSAVPKVKNEFGVEQTYKFSTNIINTVHLLENLPNVPKKFIFISTVSVYKNEDCISENSQIQCQDMYGASKIMCEAYLTRQAKEKGFILQILRLGQIYGEGEETYSKIVSFFTKQIVNDNPISIFGSGNEKRSMLNVRDCVKCILDSIDFNNSIEPVNIASSQTITVNEIIKTLYEVSGKKENIIYQLNKTSHDVVYDVSKMKKYFNISEIPVRGGVKSYYQYYIAKYGDNK